MRTSKMIAWMAMGCALAGQVSVTLAGGGGQNMFIVVDPGDENAVRIANAYQQIRGIPDANFVFIEPPRTKGYQQFRYNPNNDMNALLLDPVAQAIADRGLEGQISYIGMLGQPQRFEYDQVIGTNTYTREASVQYGLMNLTNISNHGENFYYGHGSRIYQAPGDSFYSGSDDLDAIHHDDVHQFVGKEYQYYMAGTVGYTGQFGNTADQVIASLARTAQADGTKPVGTIYFEQHDNVRSTVREGQWDWVKEELDARGIAWVESRNTEGRTPLDRDDVRGAVVGGAKITLPNGSTYLPGSWADNLTSYGAAFGISSTVQNKATEFIAAGAAGSGGTIAEPGASASRFPNASIHIYYADGATLGEAFYKSVSNPDMQMFIGDMLAQPYADVPDVAINNGPADGQIVSGTLRFGASAQLDAPTVATGIQRLELYVDGKLVQALDGDNSNFDLDTTQLSDGVHEVRVVAINDAAIETQGYTSRQIVVDNQGRSVASANDRIVAGDRGVANIQVQAAAGDNAVERIELRHLGRVVGQIGAADGSVAVDASLLGYGTNRIVPVAIYSDGQQVAGQAIELVRQPDVLAGRTPTPTAERIRGVKAEYFIQAGNGRVGGTDYLGEADFVTITDDVALAAQNSTNLSAIADHLPGDLHYHPDGIDIDGLGIRLTGRFEVTADNAGEFLFTMYNSNDSVLLLINGRPVVQYDQAPSGGTTIRDYSGRIWLGEGEHDLELLIANEDNQYSPGYFDTAVFYRGADGVTQLMGNGFVYQAIPEPATVAALGAAGLFIGGRRRGRVG